MSAGTLYGIGVGPGDPDLLTIKATKILSRVDLIFAAASPGNDHSIALQIAQPHLKPGIETRRLDFPMSGDEESWKKAWRANAEVVAEFLKTGKNAAFLTLGDPMTYSTYAYILPYLAEILPQGSVETVPGISSYQLAASRMNTPLMAGLESLTILSGVEEPEVLAELLDKSDNLAILKTYKSFDRIRALLKEKNLLKGATIFSRLGLPDESIQNLADTPEDHKAPYLSLMIVKKGVA